MTDEQRVYIRGVKGRGNEVIKMLEDRGGKLYGQIDGETPDFIYCIFHDGYIYSVSYDYELARVIMDNYREIKLPVKWKDGDVLINAKFSDIFAVCESACNTRDDTYHCYMYADFGCDEIDAEGSNILSSNYRLATPSEVEHFQWFLRKHGKYWDAENKQLVKWRWKPKNEEAYYFVDANTSVYEVAYDENNINDSINFEVGNCFRTREEAEAMAKKIKKLLKGGEKCEK